MIVPFRQQEEQPQAQQPQPDPNFLLMAAGMMQKEAQDRILEHNEPMEKKPNPYMDMSQGDLLKEVLKEMAKQGRKNLTIEGLTGTPEGEFKGPKDYDGSDDPKSPYNDAEALRNSLMKRPPKERSI